MFWFRHMQKLFSIYNRDKTQIIKVRIYTQVMVPSTSTKLVKPLWQWTHPCRNTLKIETMDLHLGISRYIRLCSQCRIRPTTNHSRWPSSLSSLFSPQSCKIWRIRFFLIVCRLGANNRCKEAVWPPFLDQIRAK